MKNFRPFRMSAVFAVTAIVSVVLIACGSSGTAVVAPQDSATTNDVAVETTGSTGPAGFSETQVSTSDTSADTQAAALTPVDTSTDSDAQASVQAENEAVVVELTLVDDPASVEVIESVAVVEADSTETESTETALLTSYADYGFSLKLDLGAEVRSGGWTEPEPSLTQGIIAFSYGGVNANLVWGPPEDRSALTFLADTYNILRASQPAVTFESISDGDVLISDQPGVYGGFKAVDGTGTSIGGGLIGAWICGDNETAFRMTLTGEDATVVQLRFDRLLENFACSSS